MAKMGVNEMDREKRNLKLTIAYDGSGYHGFQRQLNACTVQQVLEEKLSNLLNERIAVAGAARTDAGVHAYGQVVSFWTESAIPTERIPIAMAGVLPRDIAVIDAASMPVNFHARFSSCSKIYLYRIHNTTVPNPLLRNHAWQVHRQLDAEAMHEALQSLAGEHDFSSFQAAGSSARNPVRTLYAVKCERQGNNIEFLFHGNGFLYHMVRNIVGTAVDVGMGKITQADFQSIFSGRDRTVAGATAPPNGLYLQEIFYK